MQRTILLFMTLGVVLMAPVVQAAEQKSLDRHHQRHHRATTETDRRPPAPSQSQASPPLVPSMTPFKHSGEGNNTGMSRNPDDCDTGCIGGNPD
jgi:hypothetical protein